ncbi:MAG: DUF6599 family protein [Acidobacteriaceae bacterium]
MSRTSFAPRIIPAIFTAVLALPLIGHCQGPADRATSAQKPAARPTATPLYTPPGPLLPRVFDGWQLMGTPQISDSPQAADSATAEVLREYGFSRFEAANYTRGSDTLAVKAVQFGDATGAYGAFTFYRRPNMAPEEIGQGAGFDVNRVLFWNGTVFVEATFVHITATSAGELRDLSSLLPKPKGNQGTLPTLPDYLPRQHLRPMTVQYAFGPDAYTASGGVLPGSLVDFGMSAEVVTAQYDSLNGTGTLTIINYPTPEIAANRQRAIASFLSTHGGGAAGKPGEWTPALANSYLEALQSRRSGPLVALTSGEFSAGSAQELLQRVNYEATLTLGGSGRYVPDTTKLAQLIISVAYLVGIFALIAIVAAISLGGGRALWRKMRRKSGQPEDESAEFIRLNLRT